MYISMYINDMNTVSRNLNILLSWKITGKMNAPVTCIQAAQAQAVDSKHLAGFTSWEFQIWYILVPKNEDTMIP